MAIFDLGRPVCRLEVDIIATPAQIAHFTALKGLVWHGIGGSVDQFMEQAIQAWTVKARRNMRGSHLRKADAVFENLTWLTRLNTLTYGSINGGLAHIWTSTQSRIIDQAPDKDIVTNDNFRKAMERLLLRSGIIEKNERKAKANRSAEWLNACAFRIVKEADPFMARRR